MDKAIAPAYYVRIRISSPFHKVYRLLAKRFCTCYRRCLRLEGGRLYGLIIGEGFPWSAEGSISITIILYEEAGDRVVAEVISHAGWRALIRPWMRSWLRQAYECYVGEVLSFLKSRNMDFELLDRIDDFSPDRAPYDPDAFLPSLGIEEKVNEYLEEMRRTARLPLKIRALRPCPFLTSSREFPDLYVCRAREVAYVPIDVFREDEVLRKCVRDRYEECENYKAALERLKDKLLELLLQ